MCGASQQASAEHRAAAGAFVIESDSLLSFMKLTDAGILRPSLRLMILCSRSHCSSQEDTYSVLIRFGKSILVAVLLMFRAELLLAAGAVQATLSLNINNLARLIRLPCVF